MCSFAMYQKDGSTEYDTEYYSDHNSEFNSEYYTETAILQLYAQVSMLTILPNEISTQLE